MSDRDPEARIRELKKRVEKEPGSRAFVSLAEEYRRAGRISDALTSLEEGLIAHPGYVAARVALARTYLEAGRTEESMAAFSQALQDDPSNLVAAKALGDLHLSRGQPVEALKRYLRYRGISGDHRLDDVITRLQGEVQPPPVPPPRAISATALPPPPSFRTTPLGTPPPLPAELAKPYGAREEEESPPARETDPGDISGITYERPAVHFPAADEAPAVPSRDRSLDALHAARDDEEIITRKIRLPEATWPFEATRPPAAAEPPSAAPEPPPAAAAPSPAAAEPEAPAPEPGGRALADLYFEQGHFVEARALYEDLLSAAPEDPDLTRLRDEAARREAAAPPTLPEGDPARERRLAKVRVLNEWMAAIRAAAPPTDKLPE